MNNVVPQFLDIEIHPDGFGIYCKRTNTGQDTNFTIFSPWCYKIAWITNIIHRATVICDETKIQAELNRIKKLIAWNGFPKWIGRTLTAKKLKNIKVDVIWISLPYLGMQDNQLLLSLKRKITRCLTKKSKIQTNAVNINNLFLHQYKR